MRRLLIALALVASPAFAEETWWLRSSAGEACGDGDREDLIASIGSGNANKTMLDPGDSWNVVEARTIAAGNWQVCTDLDVATGGGPAGRVAWVVARYNSSCVQQGADIINEESANLPTGVNEACSATADPGQLAFASGDFVVVTVSKTRGTRTILLQYNNSTADWDSRLTHPDEFVASARSRLVDVK